MVVESAFELPFASHDGELGGSTALNPIRPAWPSCHKAPHFFFTEVPAGYVFPGTAVRHRLGFALIPATFMASACPILSPPVAEPVEASLPVILSLRSIVLEVPSVT